MKNQTVVLAGCSQEFINELLVLVEETNAIGGSNITAVVNPYGRILRCNNTDETEVVIHSDSNKLDNGYFGRKWRAFSDQYGDDDIELPLEMFVEQVASIDGHVVLWLADYESYEARW